MTKLPRRVQEQADEADALERSLTQQANPEPPQTDATPPEAPSEPETPEEPQSTPEPYAPQSNREDTVEYWQQRYRTMEGKYNAEVPRMMRQMEQMASQFEAIQQQLHEQSQTPPQQEPQQPPVADPKDIETFGADLVEMVQRNVGHQLATARRHLMAELGPVLQRIERLENDVRGVSSSATETQERIFFSTLAQRVPQWESINVDPAFTDWLQVRDPIHGTSRQDSLNHARATLDIDRVVAIFQAFQQSTTQTQQARKDSMASQVTPDGAAPAPAATPAPVRFFTSKEVHDFYNDVARGRYANNREEAARIEAEIDRAAAEGRIQ